MFKTTRTYTDFDGKERTEDFYFNLTKAEVFKMDVMAEGGMVRSLQKIIDEQDGKKLYERFEEFVDMSYGEKSLDGRRFQKSPEILEKFKQTEAYSDLIVELATNSEFAAAFINGILPTDNQAGANTPANAR